MVKFCPFHFKIFNGIKILTSIKDRNYVTNLQKMIGNHANLDLVNMNEHTKFGQILSILKLLSGNEIMTSIKDSNSVKNLQKMMGNNPNPSECSEHIEQKQNSDISQGQ